MRLLEYGIALVITGAIGVFAGPFFFVWTFYWLERIFG